MNTDIAFDIVELAVSLAKSQTSGDIQPDVTFGETLLEIIETATRAYEDHTGEALDPFLIKAEDRYD